MGCSKLPQLAESVPLATPLARFGKSARTASKKRAETSNALLSVAYRFSLLKSRPQLYRSYTALAAWRVSSSGPPLPHLFFMAYASE